MQMLNLHLTDIILIDLSSYLYHNINYRKDILKKRKRKSFK